MTTTQEPTILVLSRKDAEAYQPGDREVCISITERWHAPLAQGAFVAVLHAPFALVGDGELTEAEADRIAAFVRDHLDATRFVIHCGEGSVRSPAVAGAIADALRIRAEYTASKPRLNYPEVRAIYRRVRLALDRLGVEDVDFPVRRRPSPATSSAPSPVTPPQTESPGTARTSPNPRVT